MGEHCSATRRRRRCDAGCADTLKCEFLLDKVGETYDGVVGVNSFGIFVELNDIYISPVQSTALDYDCFHFDPIGHRLRGDRTGKVYRLEDSLTGQDRRGQYRSPRSTSCFRGKGRGAVRGGRPGRSDRNDDKGKRTSSWSGAGKAYHCGIGQGCAKAHG